MSGQLHAKIERIRKDYPEDPVVKEYDALTEEIVRLMGFTSALLIVYDGHSEEEADKIVRGVMAGEKIEVNVRGQE